MMSEKIRILLIKEGISITELANILGTTPQNLSGKLKRDNFSQKELHDIANALNVQYEGIFTLKDGSKL